MTDYEVGYGKPPKHSRFKKGVSPNPEGRRKRKPLPAGDIINDALNAPAEYRERGKTKKATRGFRAISEIAATSGQKLRRTLADSPFRSPV